MFCFVLVLGQERIRCFTWFHPGGAQLTAARIRRYRLPGVLYRRLGDRRRTERPVSTERGRRRTELRPVGSGIGRRHRAGGHLRAIRRRIGRRGARAELGTSHERRLFDFVNRGLRRLRIEDRPRRLQRLSVRKRIRRR